MSVPFEPLPPDESPHEKRKSCLYTVITVVLVISLLVSSGIGFVWLVTQQAAETAETPTPAVDQAPVTEAYTAEAAEQLVEPLESNTPEALDTIAVPSTLTSPEVPRLNRIVFVNEELGIETVAPDGSEGRTLTSDSHVFQFPAWSPDGRQIAALGGNRSGGGIFLLQDEDASAEPMELYFSDNQNPFYLYWSPDSEQISFLANNPGGGIGLNVIEAEAGRESRLIATGSPLYWNWTADSKQMLIHSGEEAGDTRLVLIDNEGQDQAPQIPAPGYFQTPGISPSGRYWAYAQLQDGGMSWLTIDDQISGEQQTERHSGSVAMNWSPVADKLAFISGDSESQFGSWGPLRLLDAASSEMRVLSSNQVLAFFWSPDGKSIATISTPSPNGLDGGVEVRDVKRGQLARNNPTRLPVQRVPHQFMLSVIDVETGSGLELADVALSTTFLTQFLVFFDQYGLSHNLWSPSSDALVLPVIINGENQIVVISTQSGRMTQVGNGHMAFWSKQ